jgi:gluconolactonase
VLLLFDRIRIGTSARIDVITVAEIMTVSLTGRRLFAMADTTIPDGIKCDPAGNVYSGCGDGVNVWPPGGVLLWRILVEGGVANFCWGRDGEMFLMDEHRLHRAKLTGEDTKGAVIGV